eukprot:2200419-Rhodomonas_salina.1
MALAGFDAGRVGDRLAEHVPVRRPRPWPHRLLHVLHRHRALARPTPSRAEAASVRVSQTNQVCDSRSVFPSAAAWLRSVQHACDAAVRGQTANGSEPRAMHMRVRSCAHVPLAVRLT